jgi:hypothetical protein
MVGILCVYLGRDAHFDQIGAQKCVNYEIYNRFCKTYHSVSLINSLTDTHFLLMIQSHNLTTMYFKFQNIQLTAPLSVLKFISNESKFDLWLLSMPHTLKTSCTNIFSYRSSNCLQHSLTTFSRSNIRR